MSKTNTAAFLNTSELNEGDVDLYDAAMAIDTLRDLKRDVDNVYRPLILGKSGMNFITTGEASNGDTVTIQVQGQERRGDVDPDTVPECDRDLYEQYMIAQVRWSRKVIRFRTVKVTVSQ